MAKFVVTVTVRVNPDGAATVEVEIEPPEVA
jgi:hypothetical protein